MAQSNVSSSYEHPVNESDARMYAIMMADLGMVNRDRLTSIPEPGDVLTVDHQALNRKRASHIPGTKEYQEAAAHKQKINEWNNASELLGDDDMPEDHDIAGGQTHRAKLTASIHPGGTGMDDEGQRHLRSGNSARLSRGGGIARERGRGGRYGLWKLHPSVASSVSHGSSSRGGLTAGTLRSRTNVNIMPHEKYVQTNEPPIARSRPSAQAFDPSRLVTPANFFARIPGRLRESSSETLSASAAASPSVRVSPSVGASPSLEVSPSVAVPPPHVPDKKVQQTLQIPLESTAPAPSPSDTRDTEEAASTYIEDLKLPPHKRRTKVSRQKDQVGQPEPRAEEQKAPLAPPQIAEESSSSQVIVNDIVGEPSELHTTPKDLDTVTEKLTTSVLLNLLDEDVPMELDTPLLPVHQGGYSSNKAMASQTATSYTNDLQDVDATKGWHSVSHIDSDTTSNWLRKSQKIFDKILQLTKYIDEEHREEAVALLTEASGLTKGATPVEYKDQAVSVGELDGALAKVSLQRTSNLGTGEVGQTSLSQSEVRQILAHGPVPQSDLQAVENVQIKMLLQPKKGDQIDVSILAPKDHPMFFPVNPTTLYYAWCQPGEPLPVSYSLSEDTTSDTTGLADPAEADRTPSVQRLPRRSRQPSPISDDLPQFHPKKIPHELPPWMTEKSQAPIPVLETESATPTPTVVSSKSIHGSFWAPRGRAAAARGPLGQGSATQAYTAHPAEHIKPESTDPGAAARAQHAFPTVAPIAPGRSNSGRMNQDQPTAHQAEASMKKASDPGAAARAQYAQPAPSNFARSSEDPGLAARAQYFGLRRVYDDENEAPISSSEGNPFVKPSSKSRHQDKWDAGRSSNATS